MSDPDRRKVWFSETLALGLGASLVTWGEPDEDGFYNPVLTRAATPAPLDVRVQEAYDAGYLAGAAFDPVIAATPAPLDWERVRRALHLAHVNYGPGACGLSADDFIRAYAEETW